MQCQHLERTCASPPTLLLACASLPTDPYFPPSAGCLWHIRQFVTLTEPRGWLSNLEDFNSFIGFARASPTLRDKVLATRHRNRQGNNGRPYLSSLSVRSGIKLTCHFHAACKEDGIVRYVKDLASSARGLKRLDLLVE